MRVHRLRVTAFGPFPGSEEVDLDALAESGLFLLHGATGAGKTSLLDAVCFALYGCVPGARAGVTRLRSDHAPDGVPPEVVCEFSAGGRRFEVTRSPAWERPKRRGAGTTTEQARVLLRERVDGDWNPVTNRVDEAGHLLEEVLGLGVQQFTKLVLLPQGDFAAFLRADAETRRSMLERLFGTDRFAAVQQWVRERHQASRLEVEAVAIEVGRLVARAEQAAAGIGVLGLPPPAPDGGTPPDPAAPSDPAPTPDPARPPDPVTPAGTHAAPESQDELRRVVALRASVTRQAEDAIARRAATTARLDRAVSEHAAGRALSERWAQRRALAERRERLAAGRAEQEARRRRLEEARRDAALVPLLGPLDAAARARDEAGRLEAIATAAAAAVLDRDGVDSLFALPVSDEDLHAGAATARQLVSELRAAEEEAARAAAVDAALSDAQARAARRVADAAAAEERLAAARTSLQELVERRAAVEARLSARTAATASLESARAIVTAWRDVHRLDHEVAVAAVRGDELRRRRDDARERWLDLRERRLDGMAAELAAGLDDGRPCPVCGSDEHPAPALAARRPVDAAAEETARHAAEAAADAVAAWEAELAAVRARLTAAGQATRDRSEEQARADLAAAEADVADLDRCADLVGSLDQDLAAARAALTTADGAHRAAMEALEEARHAVARAQERRAALQDRVTAARGGAGSLAKRRAEAERTVDVCERALAARRTLDAARASHAEITRAAGSAAADGGFADLAAAAAAALDEVETARLEAALTAHDGEEAAVADRERQPEHAGPLPPAPDLAALATAEELARADDQDAANRMALCAGALDAVVDLERRLGELLEATTPLRRRHRTLAELCRCLDGTGGDNTKRMSLSAYVLAARLEQVAEAASVRLSAMSGGRYGLVHSDTSGLGRGRSGLSLKVVDGWTGRQRDTATLSGGESFYTSLALALGLADVVSAEAGGTTIETLFVDEGFGTLDEETLDEVMDVLDGLRSGGRAVGVVSHVPDLRTRIPARLEVVKTRTGSTVRQASA